jgi:hypothetical protein
VVAHLLHRDWRMGLMLPPPLPLVVALVIVWGRATLPMGVHHGAARPMQHPHRVGCTTTHMHQPLQAVLSNSYDMAVQVVVVGRARVVPPLLVGVGHSLGPPPSPSPPPPLPALVRARGTYCSGR